MLVRIFFLLALRQPALQPPTGGWQEPPPIRDKLSRRAEGYSLKADNFLSALMKVADEFQIPMGIEWIKTQSTLRSVDLSWKTADVRGIIAALTKDAPGYAFDVADGVVHVFPRRGIPNRQDFLSLKIQKFEVKNEVVGLADRELRRIARSTVSPPKPLPPGAGEAGSMAARVGEQGISFELEKSTVRGVLDKFILLSDRRIWVVTFTDSPGLTPTGFRRTELLRWHQPIPDEDQPVWDLFRWSDPIPEVPSRE